MSGASATGHRNSVEVHPHNPHWVRYINPTSEQVAAMVKVDPYTYFDIKRGGWIWHGEVHADVDRQADELIHIGSGALIPKDNSGEVTKATDQRMGFQDSLYAAGRMNRALRAYTRGLTKPVTCRAAIIERMAPIFEALRHDDPIVALHVAVSITEKGDYDFRARRAVLAALDDVMIHFPKVFQRTDSTSIDRHVEPHVPKPSTTLGSTTISGTIIGSGTGPSVSVTIGTGTNTSITTH